MKDVLTQEEVDALLRDVSNGNIETGKGPRFNPEDVKDFDLSAMESAGHDNKPDIEFVNEVFARYFQHSIRKLLNDQLVDLGKLLNQKSPSTGRNRMSLYRNSNIPPISSICERK